MLYQNVQVMAHTLRFVDAIVVTVGATGLAWFGIQGGAAHRELLLPGLEVFAVTLFIAFLMVGERMRIYFARRTEAIAHELLVVNEVALYSCSIAVVATEIWGGGLPNYLYLEAIGAALVVLPLLRLAMRFTLRGLRASGRDY